MTRETDPVLREQYCFGCGRHNPIGFHLVFERDSDPVSTRPSAGGSDGVIAYYVPRREDEGFPGIMHGGLQGLLLDEACGWAMFADHVFAVTARIETRYRRTVGIEAPVVARARVVRQRGRRIEIEATLSDVGGAVCVEATALFLRMDAAAEARALGSFRAGEGGAAWV